MPARKSKQTKLEKLYASDAKAKRDAAEAKSVQTEMDVEESPELPTVELLPGQTWEDAAKEAKLRLKAIRAAQTAARKSMTKEESTAAYAETVHKHMDAMIADILALPSSVGKVLRVLSIGLDETGSPVIRSILVSKPRSKD